MDPRTDLDTLPARPRLGLPPAEDVAPAEAATAPPAQVQDRGLATLLLPAKNEEDGIGETLRSLPLETLAHMGFRTEVVVVDGSSEDGTRQVARVFGARVVRQTRKGKGRGIRDARPSVAGDFVVMMDADRTYAADTIPHMLDALARGEADVVMGSRARGWTAPGAMPPMNRLGNRLLSTLASVLYHRVCTDVCTGLWGFRGNVFRSLPLRSRGFELEAEMFGLCARAGLRIVEVPVDYLPRRGATKLSKVGDAVRIAWCLVRTRVRRGRLYALPPFKPLPPASGPGNGAGGP